MSLQAKNFEFKGMVDTPEQKGKNQPIQSISWAFTLNNYLPCDLDRLASLDYNNTVEYLVYGKEVSSTGTPHLQGTVKFFKKKRLGGVISTIGQAHVTPCRDFQKSVEYCKKDGDVTEFGTFTPTSQGKRSDIMTVMDDIYAGHKSLDYFRETHPAFYATHKPFLMEQIAAVHYQPDEAERLPLYIWQAELYQYLKQPICDRTVLFVVDALGNKGKSYFTSIYKEDNPETTQIFTPGKLADMAFAYKPSTRVLFIDCPRSKQQFLSYEFLENIKNGRIFSGKYDSQEKHFNKPHVVVFMNSEPDMNAFSRDRYLILTVNEELCQVHAGAVTNKTGILYTARRGRRQADAYGLPVNNVNAEATAGHIPTVVDNVEGTLMESVVEELEENEN